MTTRIIFSISFILFSITSFAQKEMGLHFMRDIWQSSRTNPAFAAPFKFVWAGLEVGNNLGMEGPSIKQFITIENGTATLSVSAALDAMEPENSIKDELDLSIINLGIKIKNANISLGHSVKGMAMIKYPKTLPEVLLRGNAPYIGKTVQMSPEFSITSYQELSIGASYKLKELSLGAKFKFLNGIVDLSTDKDKHSIALTTDSDIYQLTIAGDYILNTANSLGIDISENFDNVEPDINSPFDLMKSNKGTAFDLGFRYEMGKWDFAASIIDIGKINWTEGVTNFTSSKTVKYEGLDISGSLTGEGVDTQTALDTLEAILDIDKSSNAYSTTLPMKTYLSARYKLTQKITASGMFFNESLRGDSFTAFALGINAALLRGLNLGATYAVKGDTYNNLGLNLMVTLGPFQFYALTDNFTAAINPMNSKHFNFRFGGNLVFGKLYREKKNRDKAEEPLKLY